MISVGFAIRIEQPWQQQPRTHTLNTMTIATKTTQENPYIYTRNALVNIMKNKHPQMSRIIPNLKKQISFIGDYSIYSGSSGHEAYRNWSLIPGEVELVNNPVLKHQESQA